MKGLYAGLELARGEPRTRLLTILLAILVVVLAFQWWVSRPHSYGPPHPISVVMESQPAGGGLTVDQGITQCMKRRGLEPIWASADYAPTAGEHRVAFSFKFQGQRQEAVWFINMDTRRVRFGNAAARMVSSGCQ